MLSKSNQRAADTSPPRSFGQAQSQDGLVRRPWGRSKKSFLPTSRKRERSGLDFRSLARRVTEGGVEKICIGSRVGLVKSVHGVSCARRRLPALTLPARRALLADSNLADIEVPSERQTSVCRVPFASDLAEHSASFAVPSTRHPRCCSRGVFFMSRTHCQRK